VDFEVWVKQGMKDRKKRRDKEEAFITVKVGLLLMTQRILKLHKSL